MKSQKIILGLLAGVALGALAGILLAPEKGSDMRKNISKKSHSFTDKLKGLVHDIIEGVTNKYDEAKIDADQLAENVKSKTHQIASDVKTKADSVSKEMADYNKR